MSDDDLGFGALTKKKLDVSDFKPKPVVDVVDNDRAADRAGFVSREPLVRVEKIRKKNQIQDTLYVRGPLEMTNRFKEFCNEHGYSYGEGLEALMKKAKI
jgi:NAD(P)H-flavin reductase